MMAQEIELEVELLYAELLSAELGEKGATELTKSCLCCGVL